MANDSTRFTANDYREAAAECGKRGMATFKAMLEQAACDLERAGKNEKS